MVIGNSDPPTYTHTHTPHVYTLFLTTGFLSHINLYSPLSSKLHSHINFSPLLPPIHSIPFSNPLASLTPPPLPPSTHAHQPLPSTTVLPSQHNLLYPSSFWSPSGLTTPESLRFNGVIFPCTCVCVRVCVCTIVSASVRLLGWAV